MEEIFITAFASLFVVIDPLGIAPVFVALTEGGDHEFRRRMAWRGTLLASAILLFFAFVGRPFLDTLGISIDALKLAGGLMLLLLALEMVFEKRTARRESSAERAGDEHPEDISVFPLAIPLLAGPGAITTIILLMADPSGGWAGRGAVLVALLLVLSISLVTFLLAGRIVDLVGRTTASIISRVLGIVLAAFAAQFIIDGLRHAFLS